MISMRAIYAAAGMVTVPGALAAIPKPQKSYVPPSACSPPPVQQRDREVVAAILTAGMIVADGRSITAVEAVARWREVTAVLSSQAT